MHTPVKRKLEHESGSVISTLNISTLQSNKLFCFAGRSLETIKILLNAGASVNLKDDAGNSSLSIAIELSRRYKGVSPVLLLLLENGANPNAEQPGEDSPLMMAVEIVNLSVSEVLIQAGANVNHIGKSGQTALHKCISAKGQYVLMFTQYL